MKKLEVWSPKDNIYGDVFMMTASVTNELCKIDVWMMDHRRYSVVFDDKLHGGAPVHSLRYCSGMVRSGAFEELVAPLRPNAGPLMLIAEESEFIDWYFTMGENRNPFDLKPIRHLLLLTHDDVIEILIEEDPRIVVEDDWENSEEYHVVD